MGEKRGMAGEGGNEFSGGESVGNGARNSEMRLDLLEARDGQALMVVEERENMLA